MKKSARAKTIPIRPNFWEQYFTQISLGLIAVAALLYGFPNPYYRTGLVNDDAVFILGARSLWSHGPIQSFIMRPDYPLPGLPLMLAPFIPWADPFWTRLEWVSIFATVAFLGVLSFWARRFLSAREALAVLAIVAFNPLIAKFSGIVMPSIPFTLAVVGAFLLFEKLLAAWDWKTALALGGVLGWGALLRPEGGVLLASVLIALWVARTGMRRIVWVLAPLALWGIFIRNWWSRFPAPETAYGGDLQALAEYWLHDLSDALVNLYDLLSTLVIRSLIGLGSTHFDTPAWFNAIALLACLALTAHGAQVLWKERRAARPMWVGMGLFAGFYFAAHLFWKVEAPRYAIPLLPCLAVLIVRGVSRLPARFHPAFWGPVALTVLMLSYGYRTGHRLSESGWEADPKNSPPWHTLDWLREHTPADTIVMSGIGPSVELFAGRKSFPGIKIGNIETFIYRIQERHVGYILDRNVRFITPGVGAVEDPNQDWQRFRYRFASYPSIFQSVYSDELEQTHVYQIALSGEFFEAYKKVIGAYAYYQAGQMKQALESAQAAQTIFPRMALASQLLGAIYLRQVDFPRAEHFLLEANKFMPTSTKPMLNLATLYQQQGKVDLSRQWVQRASELSSAKGDQASFRLRMEEQYRQWEQHRALIFLDVP